MRKPFVVILISISILAAPLVAQPVESLAGEELLRALVREIRLLRVAMQGNASAELRAQLLLQREARAAARVDQLAQQIQHGFPDEASMVDEFEMHGEQMRAQLRSETDPDRRREIELQLSMMERRREMTARHRETERIRRSEVERQLDAERARLETLRNDLDTLMRELAQTPAP